MLRAGSTALGREIKIVILVFLFSGMLGSPSQCASPLRCSLHWRFIVEASGVPPVAHHKFPSPQQGQQLEYFSEAASAPRYICYFRGGGQGTAYLKTL